ncbi:DUF2550 family protein [Jannaschia sp. R86511]|uniref:DUF2550 family protein n=1 Tax=Jannaschia sp. R86511 TaxID=3093853 RepID=UPI0036D36DB2
MPGTDVPSVLVAVVLFAFAAAVALAVVLAWRRFSSGLGAFRCFVRLPGTTGAFCRWRRGAARFDTDALRWFPSYTLLASRSLVLDRGELELFERRPVDDDDGVPLGLTVLRGSARGRTVELAVPATSAAALVLWVESGPPGRGVNVA